MVSNESPCPTCQQYFSSEQVICLVPSVPNVEIGYSLALFPSPEIGNEAVPKNIIKHEKKEKKRCGSCKKLSVYSAEFAKVGSRTKKGLAESVEKIVKMRSLLDSMLELVGKPEED
ncbi:hypothetical protein DsansV1_C08g0087161 [Dioscorea sansibarensis]